MPAPAGGFTVCLECRPAQSPASLRPIAASAVADRSGWHSTRCSAAPGTWSTSAFAHGPVGAAAAGALSHDATRTGTRGRSSSRRRRDMAFLFSDAATSALCNEPESRG
jgi:hypothetical protein